MVGLLASAGAHGKTPPGPLPKEKAERRDETRGLLLKERAARKLRISGRG